MAEPMDRVARLYTGKNIFISGVTGFLGKVLLEKILRCCPDVEKIYVLIRKRKAISSVERLKLIFQNPLFDTIREENPNVFNKCVTVSGDVSEKDLAISEYYRNEICEEVEYIFHCAATTRFDDPLTTSIVINARGTYYMLELAKQCQKLKLFVHLSTLFAHFREPLVEEKVYPFPRKAKNIIESLPWVDEEALQRVAKDLYPDLPNTYTFSKLLAEALVTEEMENLPILLTRPSIVGPICYDPYPGWANNLIGPIGLFVAAGKGILRTCYIDKNTRCKMYPADSTINGIMLSTWDYIENNGKNVVNLYHREEKVHPTWDEIVEIGKVVIRTKVPFNIFLWYPDGSMTDNKLVYLINFYLFHIIPAIFVDFLLIILGYKPALYKAQRRIQKASDMFEYYTFKNWEFQVNVLTNINKKLNELEKKRYQTEADDEYSIEEYLLNSLRAVKKIHLKEDEKYEARALKIMNVLYPDLPNTYTFSKLLAEALVTEEMENLPILLTRPSIVGPICYDPYPGWANNLIGPIGLFVAAGKGILRTCYIDKNTRCKMYPADSTINGIMLSTWDYIENNGKNVVNLYHREEKVHPTWDEIVEIGKVVIRTKVPFNIFLWYPDGSMTDNKLVYLINFYLFHIIPAIFVDFLLIILGYKPALYKAQRRIQKASDMFEYYTFKNWEFQVNVLTNINKKLNELEKKRYQTEADDEYSIEEYLLNSLRAVKKIHLKEDEKYEARALKIMNVLYYVDRFCKLLFMALFFYYSSKLVMYVLDN